MARSQALVLPGNDDRPTVRETLARIGLAWLSLPTLLLAGLFAWLGWGGSPELALITPTLALCTAGVGFVGWRVGKRHSPHGGFHLAATIGGAGLWLILAVTVGPFTGLTQTLFWLFGPVTVISWNVRVLVTKPQRQESGDPKSPRAAAKALMSSLGLKGVDMHPKEVSSTRIAGELELDGQQTAEDVQKRAVHLATAMGAPKSGVRVNVDPTDASRAPFSIALRDVLNESTPWPGPVMPGGTVFDPIPVGLYETGEVAYKIDADVAGAKHELVQGTTGAGKSSGAKVELCELMTKREIAIIVIDTVKGLQSFGMAAPGLTKFVTKQKLAEKLIKRLRTHVIKARGDYLGARGLEAWEPGCGLSWLHIQIEEASILFEEIDIEDLQAVAKAIRSVGGKLEVSLQRPSHDQIDTTTRSLFNTVTCYGMGADDVVCVLPEEVQDAGADPRRWGDRQPGCNYLSGTRISVAQASTPLRTFQMSNAEMAAHAALYGPRMDPVDPTTVDAFGALWDQLGDPVTVVEQLKTGTPARATKARGTTSDADEDEVIDAELVDDQADDEDDQVTVTEDDLDLDTPDPDPELRSDIDDPVDSIEVDIPFGQPKPELSIEDARRLVAERIDELEADGKDEIRVPDLAELIAEGFRSRAWFRKELFRLCEAGRLTDEKDGRFSIVAGGDDDGTENDDDSDMEDAA
jgi:hypothetical protein